MRPQVLRRHMEALLTVVEVATQCITTKSAELKTITTNQRHKLHPQVLRRHKEALLTVVEVVIHDPLYR